VFAERAVDDAFAIVVWPVSVTAESDVMSEFAPLAAAPRFILPPAAVVAPVPP
jgi:hypothetical protein